MFQLGKHPDVFFLKQVLLTVGWCFEHLIFCLIRLLLNLCDLLTESLKPERSAAASSSLRREIWYPHYTLPVIVCSPLCFIILSKLGGLVYDEWLYLAGKSCCLSDLWPLWTLLCPVVFHPNNTTNDQLLLNHKYVLQAGFGFCHCVSFTVNINH